METGIDLIAQERSEQIKKHGRTIEKDIVENMSCQLKMGAVALLTDDESEFPGSWSHFICAKMFNKPYKERLIIAGALIAAEIDRLNNVQ